MVSRQFKATLQTPNVFDYYEKLGLVGEGTFGKVFKLTEKEGDRTKFYAAKCMIVHRQGYKDGLNISTCREIALLREMEHRNVIKVQKVFLNHTRLHEDSAQVSLLVDFAEYDMNDIIIYHHKRKTRPKETMFKSMMHQLLKGMQYLHTNWIFHRDLKPANVLIMGIDEGTVDKGCVKIADLGMARLFNAPLRPLVAVDAVVTTFWYRAPELLLGAQHYTKAVDMWAIGCIMAELATCAALFQGPRIEETKDPYHKQQLELIFDALGYPQSTDEPSTSDTTWQYLNKLPHYKRAKADFAHKNFDTPGSKRTSNGLDEKLRRHFKLEMRPVPKLQLLEKLLRLDPKARISATAALQNSYFLTEPLPRDNVFDDIREDEFPYPPRSFQEPKVRDSKRGHKRAAQPAGAAARADKRGRP
eukprot:m.83489 g.83489  ORF g.83489 m.83489 type:complete len:416 (+) comp9542_c0_seq1:245-1492(+)